MATKILRKIANVFGLGGATNDFAQFGSERAGSPVKTMDVAAIQALGAWATGWASAVNSSNKAPFLEDMNALHYVLSSQLGYLYQEGIPEWETGTAYFTNSIVKKTGTLELYASKTDSNIGNALPSQADNTAWKYIADLGVAAAPRFKIGQFDRAESLTTLAQSITGIGFKPSLIVFVCSSAGNSTGNPIIASIGFDDGINPCCIGTTYIGWLNNSGYSVGENSLTSNYAKVSSMNSDGFSLAWTRTNNPTAGTMHITYLAMR